MNRCRLNRTIIFLVIIIILLLAIIFKSVIIPKYNEYMDLKEKYNQSVEKEEDTEQTNSEKEKENIIEKENIQEQKVSLEEKLLGKYIIFADDNSGLGILKFTKNELKCGYFASEGYDGRIYSIKEIGDTIYYNIVDGTTVSVQLLDDDTVYYNGFSKCKLLNAQQLIARVYNRFPELTNYDYLSYFGVSQQDVDKFYSN